MRQYFVYIHRRLDKSNIKISKLKCDSEEHALKLEIEMIAILKRLGVNLCNKTNGGEGTCGLKKGEEQWARQKGLEVCH